MEKRGVITGFNISYNKTMMPWEETSHEPMYQWFNGSNFNTVIYNLENYTKYSIQIAGFTKIGQGPYSLPVLIETPQNGKINYLLL